MEWYLPSQVGTVKQQQKVADGVSRMEMVLKNILSEASMQDVVVKLEDSPAELVYTQLLVEHAAGEKRIMFE
jgi:hypothetical protein